MLSNQEVIDQLRWKKFPVLSDGFVTLVDVMGDDNAVAQAARVSYGNDNPKIECPAGCDEGVTGVLATNAKVFSANVVADVEIVNCELCQGVGYLDKKGKPWKENDPEADRTLIRYLMRHRHSTPFEMAEIKLLVRVPMDCWRQWIRHRTANVNEYSTRYAPAIDSIDKTPPDQWRLQAEANRQGSDGFLTEWPEGVSAQPYGKTGRFEVEGAHLPYMMPVQLDAEQTTPGHYLQVAEERLHTLADAVYRQRLEFGVAREQARKDLPLSTYTEAYFKIDLHNMLHFLGLRMDSHAQKEIRDYATIIGEQIIKPLFPIVWEAFEDYRLGALNLTRLDIEVIQSIADELRNEDRARNFKVDLEDATFSPKEWQGLEKCRERDECIEKLKRLGLIIDG